MGQRQQEIATPNVHTLKLFEASVDFLTGLRTQGPATELCLWDGVSFCQEFCVSLKGTPLEILLRNK